MAAAAPPAPAPPAALFTFGLVADLQYADADDGTSFAGGDRRAFRASLAKAASAGAAFRAAGAAVAVQLGDLVDGRAVGAYSPMDPAGSAPEGARAAARAAVAAVLGALEGAAGGVPIAHLRGNHENYLLALDEQAALLPLPRLDPPPAAAGADVMAYAFSPARGWRFVALDTFDVSLAARAGSAARAEAEAVLRRENPNVTWDGARADWFQGRSGKERRFVPFNGGVGAAQLAWLRRELAAARAARERVVVFSHVPLLAAQTRARGGADASAAGEAGAHDCVAFNAEEVLAALAEEGAAVAAVFAGHDHEGSFGVDARGVPHVTLQSPLVHAGDAHAVVAVFRERAGGARGVRRAARARARARSHAPHPSPRRPPRDRRLRRRPLARAAARAAAR